MLANAGDPLIVAVDGNHANRGQLLLRNDSGYELLDNYTVGTLKNIHALWGRPVHLDTTVDEKFVRYSIDITDIEDRSKNKSKKGYSIKVFKLKEEKQEDGKVKFVVDGSAISETKEKFDEGDA